jgi:ribosome-associated heat shock protein Hsp15
VSLVAGGHVRVNGVRQASRGRAIKSGDVLTVALDRTVHILKVVDFAERRGDAPSARRLYSELTSGQSQAKSSDGEALGERAWFKPPKHISWGFGPNDTGN